MSDTKEEAKLLKEETELQFHGRFRESILSGIKRFSIRLGERSFAKNIAVCDYQATVNRQFVCHLNQVPFKLFEQEGWANIEDMLRGLRELYPKITLDSVVTIVEFRINIPPVRKA